MVGPSASGDRSSVSSPWALMQSNWANTFMFFTRVATLVSCLSFLFAPIFGQRTTAVGWYHRALLANAATSSLRLRQRISQMGTQFRFSRECLGMLLLEDSLHYLIFSLIFVMVPPVTVCLLPIFCFALLHSASFIETLLRASSRSTSRPPESQASGDGDQDSTLLRSIRKTIAKVRDNELIILRMIAINEILLMGMTIFMAFFNLNVIFMPFMYFQFLKLRYASRRNPYSRNTFHELRIAMQQFALNRSCPAFFARFIDRFIDFVSKLSPPLASN